jgi:hypothetical protein
VGGPGVAFKQMTWRPASEGRKEPKPVPHAVTAGKTPVLPAVSAPHLAHFSRDVGYHKPFPQTSYGLHNSPRVPYVRTSVRGPKTMGEAPSTAFRSVEKPRSQKRDLGHPLIIRPRRRSSCRNAQPILCKKISKKEQPQVCPLHCASLCRKTSSRTPDISCPAQRIGCPILCAFCEGWDKQNLRGRASGGRAVASTLRKECEGWGTDPLCSARSTRL